ncbi:MAG: methylated-DNA--[protein]-cysteine S-methyltransferase [Chloroflexaceae bacterium]|nr:methylated-DNA--[protein]-cysteine S-methyltransferase [Chloroflexaceae bacterium]NJO06033.1 methylated-DNA--[protein]-cysteine S-methyltransferase [Chloroflexaceae bacterium]
MKHLHIDRIAAPIGEVLLVVDGAAVCALDYADYEQRMMKLLHRRYGAVELVPATDPHGYSSVLRAYFAGDLHAIDVLPVSTGGTPFQQQVWHALRSIAPGTVLAYGQLAAHMGRPTAARAVGMTNGLNPVAIVLPCHRVVGANAALTGYAGGLDRKVWLLQHEGVIF